jgi:Arc/MetJ-type ribon-helix-helix transcriptional regulator
MRTKVRTSVALDKDLLDWVFEMTKRKRFANTSHAIELALTKLREEEKRESDIHFGIFESKTQLTTETNCNT